MKNSVQNHIKLLIVSVLCFSATSPVLAQLFKYTLTQTGTTICVKAVPQFTASGACYHGGNAVLITPTTVSIESGDITNALGTWSIASSATFMGINFYQFGSESLSQNQSFVSGTPVTLFCVAISPTECTSGQVRLMEQVNHSTPPPSNPDLALYNAGVQHAVAASFANNCNPENGTVFDGLTGTTSISCLLLPVELVKFEAVPQERSVLLEWRSASERNFSGYELQRSTDGQSFSKIAWLPAAGGSHQQDYRHEDADVRPGVTYYYRLKMLDLDGSFEYSRVRSAKLEGAGQQEILISPNPAMGYFTVKFETEQPGTTTLELVNEQGQVVLQQRYELSDGPNALMVNGGHVPAGNYLVKIKNMDGVQTGKVVVGRI